MSQKQSISGSKFDFRVHQSYHFLKFCILHSDKIAKRLGATLATVDSYEKAAHALYESMGFTEFDLLEPWIKE